MGSEQRRLSRALRAAGVVVAVIVGAYVVGALLFLASCSSEGGGEGDIRPRTTTER